MRTRLTSPLATVMLCLAAAPSLHAQEAATYDARDTLNAAADTAPAAQAILEAVTWEPADFTVRVTPSSTGDYAARVTFRSPMADDDDQRQLVWMRWYAARDGDGQLIEAPAVVVVHTLHPQMIIGSAIARSFAQQGLHAFLLEMPGYGARRDAGRVPGLVALDAGAQAVAEVRRARDAVAALPKVTDGAIALQGTSLGGFVAAVAGALDGAFEPVLLLLAGADGFDVLRNGAADAARLRELAHAAGHDDAALRDMLEPMDPRHVAHRLDARHTWLFSARDDRVVPRRNSDLLAEAIGLGDGHHVQLAGGHYTSLLLLPGLVPRMGRIIKGDVDDP
ncbi:MAG: alpha/beta hydrolase family protein [Phycisphaeraceae bacterium]